MFKIYRKEIEWGGRTLTLETGKVARQADGSVMASYGDTTVLATVVAAKEAKPDIDFFPLTVHYQEKSYAAGKIPGGFLKREGRPSDKETLTSRLIDRPIRPLFVDGFKNETQVVVTVLSHDMENDPDIVSMIAASAALTISGVPFMGPIGAARVAYINNEFVLNPSIDQYSETNLDLVIAGTSDAVLMVESEAKELTEEQMLDAVVFGHENFQPVIETIIGLAELCAKEPMDVVQVDNSNLATEIKSMAEDEMRSAYKEVDKVQRQIKISEVKNKVLNHFCQENKEDSPNQVLLGELIKGLEKEIVRGNILNTGSRIDGRDLKTVRPIVAEVGILPRAHGSALFTRGETQALVVTTLGTGDDEQIIDTLNETYRESFMLHYNFPPYSVGEVGRMGATSRREVGHGKLAWRAIHPILPGKENFPYTIRLVSEITESNGSSSMATVCGSSLALMDAGVPMAKPVAGIAMGLIKDGDKYAVLSDILGDEDHLGDMDFKVAGTKDGITSLQMDIKITGITKEIMQIALTQAKEGRQHILSEMSKAITESRVEMGEYAPRIEVINIPVDKIRDVIGTGGKVIRQIIEETGTKIDISDDGMVKVASNDAKSIEMAIEKIKYLTAVPEVGKIYEGKVAKVVDFGAFVNFLGRNDGLVHISQISNEKIANVSDVLKEGDIVKVKLLDFDERGRVRLSMKVIDQESGKEIS